MPGRDGGEVREGNFRSPNEYARRREELENGESGGWY